MVSNYSSFGVLEVYLKQKGATFRWNAVYANATKKVATPTSINVTNT